MSSNKIPSNLFLIVSVSFLFLIAVSLPAFGEDLTGRNISWQLSDARIVDAGKTTNTGEGVLTMGYTIEANATSEDAPIKKGLFKATLSAFSPDKKKNRLIKQQKGVWYISGKWEIIDAKATAKILDAKHNEASIKGLLNGELTFNPAAQQGLVIAATELPMSPVGKYWGKGTGHFSGNEKLEGNFDLTITRWQKVKK